MICLICILSSLRFLGLGINIRQITNAYVTITTYILLLHYHICGNAYCITLVPTPAITVSPSSPIQGGIVGDFQVINCVVSTVSGVDSSLVMISWMGPGGGPIINDSRVSISSTTSSGNNYTSSVQFTYLMEGDEGTYTCNVMILDANVSQSVEILPLTSKFQLPII